MAAQLTVDTKIFTPTSRPVSGSYVYKYWREISLTAGQTLDATRPLTGHDFRVDCELCRHWGLSRRTGKSRIAPGRRGTTGAKQIFLRGRSRTGRGRSRTAGAKRKEFHGGDPIL
ncbi:hypothetical protein Bbelb_066020 [Branchiostoma belcheri]|nr:hypothetical protein Bbelb_066020 [Branchiostoma belcheri]